MPHIFTKIVENLYIEAKVAQKIKTHIEHNYGEGATKNAIVMNKCSIPVMYHVLEAFP